MEKRYTAGELARWAGVSARTIRFYEEKGILQPRERSAEGYRLYDDSAILRLQEILMLKYLGMSLEGIQQALAQGENLPVFELLTRQRELVLEERCRLDRILKVIDQAQRHCQGGQLPISRFAEIMQLLTKNQQANFRYNLYERYGTSGQKWHEWLFRQLPIGPETRVLDVGCGHGNVWHSSWREIPAGCQITLLDKETDGLQFLHGIYLERRRELAEGTNFCFLCEDAEEWECPAERYDLILAGHLWNYIRDKEGLLRKLHQGLAEGGRLVSTFTSQVSAGDVNRLLEPVLHRRVLEAYEERRQDFVGQMEELFAGEFAGVSRKVFRNGLRIDQPEQLLRYLCNLDGELEARIRSRESEVRKYLQELIRQGPVPEIGTEGYCYFCESDL